MILFVIGQLGWSMLSGIINAWLVTFYLPTSGDKDAGAVEYIQPGLVILGFLTILGLITALSRIFDAVTDPLIANLSGTSCTAEYIGVPCPVTARRPGVFEVTLPKATVGKLTVTAAH